jgi:hypothetical protein
MVLSIRPHRVRYARGRRGHLLELGMCHPEPDGLHWRHN